MVDMEHLAVTGHRPWNSPYYGEAKKPEEVYGADDQIKINKCMSCTRAVCINCLDTKSKVKYDKEALFNMLIAGKREALICTALGVNIRTVRLAQKELEKELMTW